jgi:hypothetical protein
VIGAAFLVELVACNRRTPTNILFTYSESNADWSRRRSTCTECSAERLPWIVSGTTFRKLNVPTARKVINSPSMCSEAG